MESSLTLLTLPIGNYEDISLNALKALKEGEHFATEDTRVFKELLKYFGIPLDGKNIFPYHDHTQGEERKILKKILEGHKLYVVSDAGSPLLSDPAFPLVREALSLGIKVESISGISSVTMALELSGLPPIPFHFHGFVPREKGKREEYFKSAFKVKGTHIYFEGVSRVMDSLNDLVSLYPEAEIAVARELSKNFETIYRFKGFPLPEITLKGEFVILIHQEHEAILQDEEATRLATELVEEGVSNKVLSKLLAKLLDDNPKQIYQKLLKNKKIE